ncbi:acyltransferase [Actinokineospora auranticolor]|uniref:Transferase family protein n=1 Tax=Actinokineospora auranticolor TaxID=155976 RepID=A0A2S6GEG9_9PSEU|nr:acyltransferase [Actinokineospora auranticolor]PPK63612.1 transferase family protein [Actinokineospora auranticolor]
MSGWPELRSSRTVRAGHAPGTVIRCGVTDTVIADVPVSVVFFYQRALSAERLADGLSTALAAVPAFAGRLRTVGDQLEIVCDDSGVPFETYDVDDTLPKAIGRVTLPGGGFVDHVQANAARVGGLPLLTVRLTLLSDGSSALGCSFHHSVGDLASFMLLVRAWSAAVESTTAPEITQLTDPDAFLDASLPAADSGTPGFRLPTTEDAKRLATEFESAVRANRTVQVYFTDEEVSRLRAETSAAAGRSLSANDVLCAHLAHTLRALDGDTEEPRSMALPVNVRRFLGIEPGVVGNLVSEIFLTTPPAATAAEIATRIREAVEEFPTAHLKLRANRAFLESIGRDRLNECIPCGFDPERKTLTITNWSRFGIYDVAFEGARPAFFSPTSNLQLPWVAWLVEGFHGSGTLLTIAVPARLATTLRGAVGRAALHPHRREDDPALPELVTSVRKLA